MTKSRSVEGDNNQDVSPLHGLGLGGCQPGQGHNAFDIMEDHTSHGACFRLNYIPLPKDMLKSYLGTPVTSKHDFIWN